MLKNFLAIVVVALVLICCDDTAVKPVKFRPSRIEEIGYKRELTYDSHGNVTTITSTTEMVDKHTITTVQKIEYDAEGKISKSMIDNEREYRYEWRDGRLGSTEELEHGIRTRRYTFVYNFDGTLKEMLNDQHEAIGAKHLGKVSYAFDADGNVSSVKSFQFKDGFGYELEGIFEFDRYDDRESVDSKFDVNPLITGTRLHKNNPGRMVTKNKNGVATSIEDYVYEYTSNGLALKRESTITFLHIGSTGSYVTNYFFEQY